MIIIKIGKLFTGSSLIACLAVLSMLLTSASAQDDWMRCPSGWEDRDSANMRDPATVYYMRDIRGIGKEDVATTVATHGCFTGITAELSARGTGEIYSDR